MASKREMCLQLREANLAKAEFLYLTGEKEATVAQLDKTLEKLGDVAFVGEDCEDADGDDGGEDGGEDAAGDESGDEGDEQVLRGFAQDACQEGGDSLDDACGEEAPPTPESRVAPLTPQSRVAPLTPQSRKRRLA